MFVMTLARVADMVLVKGGRTTFELRIPQENKETCEKSAKTFKFSLPVISMDTKCEPKKDNEEPTIQST